MLTGPEVQLTPAEIGVVQGRLNDNAEKERQKRLGDGDSSTSDSVHADMAKRGGGKEAGDAGSPNTGSTRLTYGQVHAALFRSQDLEALVAAFMREGELREKDE
ncbi:unnamed protein product, partial [Ectocarpus sp. 13 AM-2016]